IFAHAITTDAWRNSLDHYQEFVIIVALDLKIEGDQPIGCQHFGSTCIWTGDILFAHRWDDDVFTCESSSKHESSHKNWFQKLDSKIYFAGVILFGSCDIGGGLDGLDNCGAVLIARSRRDDVSCG
ncbi:MAG: hypothetical protein E6Z08_10280, partial [Lacticaseibacillus rhamnosus]|nr:hypothetical protein [Lacticaseibacillus rhamnosus]MDU5935391.1 hypothetical protein [Lacticaseibacillus rhamnosus]